MGKPIGLSKETLNDALDPSDAVKQRTLYGGPAPEETRARAEDAAKTVESDSKNVADKLRRLKEAEARLESGIDELIASAW